MSAALVTVVLVHSPFLGPASLRPLADALTARGVAAVVPQIVPNVLNPPVHQQLIGTFADATADEEIEGPLVLVGHSGIGALLPALADEMDTAVTCLVHLDAVLPSPGLSWRDTAPPELYSRLRAMARDGVLPPWPRWWDETDLATLVPDAELRERILGEASEVPLGFLKEARPSVPWTGPVGYLALSAAYHAERDIAAGLGWPVRTVDGTHLSAATEPDLVATALLDLLNELLPD